MAVGDVDRSGEVHFMAHILIIDDDAAVGHMVGRMVGKLDHSYDVAQSLDEGLEEGRSCQPE